MLDLCRLVFQLAFGGTSEEKPLLNVLSGQNSKRNKKDFTTHMLGIDT